jgi:hypothetical protein
MQQKYTAAKLIIGPFAAFLCLVAGTGAASGAAISVFSTGASVTAGQDNNYQITTDTTGEDPLAPNQAFLVTTVPGDWAAPIAGSAWIGPQADESSKTTPNGCCTGSDTYQTTFSLAGLNPGTAILNIIMSADDDADVWLNGIEVYKTGQQEDYRPGDIALTINNAADFLSGVNTLDFVVANGTGSTGLDVAVNGTASLAASAAAVPEPGSKGLLVCLSIVAAAFGIRRKQLVLARQIS